MILSDSDVFLIDRIYTRDARYEVNRHFIEKLPKFDVATSIYNLRLFGISQGHGIGVLNLLRRWRDKPQQVGDSGSLSMPTPKDPNLLEICGIAANVLPRLDLEQLFYYFDELYGVEIIYPKDSERTIQEYFRDFAERMFRLVSQKMKYPDAQILFSAEEYGVSHLVTWNTKDFKGRTHIPILTPAEFLEEYSELKMQN